MKKLGYVILALSIIAGAFGMANASPVYVTNFGSAYPGASSSLNTCMLCHASSGPPGLNNYGVAFSSNAHNFQAIENQDSDSDGFNNIDELNAGTFPGDPTSKPAAPPPPPTSAMDMPTGQIYVSYPASSSPSMDADPMLARPVGVGAVASGGDTLTVNLNFAQFSGGADIYLAYGISADPANIYIMKPDYSLQAVSLQEIILALATGVPPAGIEPWRSNTTGPVDEVILDNILIDNIATGTYSLYAVATPSGNLQNYYLWRTEFTVAEPDGVTLYAQNCASCHGSLTKSTKAQASASAIQSAIGGNVGGMGYLQSLSTVKVQAIADVLAQQTPPPPPPPPATTDGATLYSQSCASCHGTLASSVKTGATASAIQSAINSNAGGMGSLSNLSSTQIQAIAGVLAQQTPPSAPPAPTTTDGARLYALSCASCHGTLASSAKTGATATAIQSAINGNVGGMGSLSNLTSAQVQSIAGSLAAQTPPPPPTTTDGATLYAQSCASCHGQLASSTKTGTTATKIQNAINGNVGGMGSLSNLTSAQVQAIAGVLAAQTPPPPPPPPTTTDGATLYSQNCASCHGQLASSTKTGTTATKIQNAINGNVGGMGSLSNLTSAQVQAIAGVLAAQTPPPPTTTDGATLYSQNCSSCHGTLDNSEVTGKSASSIQKAIDNDKGGMGSLSNLTSAQVQAIAGVLAAQTPPPPPPTTDGATLYSQNCASCHGQLASSTKIGTTATKIQNAINGNVGGMGSLSNLTSTQVLAIADVLALQTPIPPAPSHPVNWYKDHRSYVGENGTLECVSCHGADLTGGSGPSCYSCHGKKW
jgi:mono/diheme cytochrome c family protein